MTLCGCHRYMRLAVVPDNTPLPMTMLSKLWQQPAEGDAEASANMLQQLSIMRVAFLYDGSAWALVDNNHMKHLQVATAFLNACLCVALVCIACKRLMLALCAPTRFALPAVADYMHSCRAARFACNSCESASCIVSTKL